MRYLSRCLAAACFSMLAALLVPATASAECVPSELRSVINRVSSIYGPVKIISAHRPGARIAGSGRPSYHASCRAVDIVPPSGRYAEVASWLKANHHGGVGTYSGSFHHIHIDTGPSVRFHHGSGGTEVASNGGSRRSGRKATRVASNDDDGEERRSYRRRASNDDDGESRRASRSSRGSKGVRVASNDSDAWIGRLPNFR